MAGPRSTKTEETPATEPIPAVLERGASLSVNVTVLRIVGAYVHLDVLGTPVVLLKSRLERAI
jgi:hypothetical protein